MSHHVKLYAPAISCHHCAMTIKRELAAVQGLSAVVVDVPTKIVELDVADEAALARAKAVLEEIGYPVEAN